MARIAESERLYAITELERTFWVQPGVLAAGMDEVGRGPLAGPVVAACVILPATPLIEHIKDSKKLSEKRRTAVYPRILEHAIGHATGWVWQDEIDRINILQATRLAMCEAFRALSPAPTDVLIDAIQALPIDARQHAYIRGDAISYLIAAASIVAKVARDQYMCEQDARYPQYGFARNKGYGTAEHIAALRTHGPCPIHRQSFIGKFL